MKEPSDIDLDAMSNDQYSQRRQTFIDSLEPNSIPGTRQQYFNPRPMNLIQEEEYYENNLRTEQDKREQPHIFSSPGDDLNDREGETATYNGSFSGTKFYPR